MENTINYTGITQPTTKDLRALMGSIWEWWSNGEVKIHILIATSHTEYVLVGLDDGNRMRTPSDDYNIVTEGCGFVGWFDITLNHKE